MIGEVITAVLPTLRANALSLMTDTCIVERSSATWDEAQQKSVTVWATVHADVPCHVESPTVADQTLLTGELVAAESPIVKVPHTYTDILPDDRVTVTGGDVMFVTRAAHDDRTHPVETVIQCRWTR